MRDIDTVQLTGITPDSYKDRQCIDHIRGCGTEKRRALQSPWPSIAGHWWSRRIVSFRYPWKSANIETELAWTPSTEFIVRGTPGNDMRVADVGW